MKKSELRFIALMVALAITTACGKDSDTITLAGRVSVRKPISEVAGGPAVTQDTNLSSYKMRCITFSNMPATASSTLAMDGTFSLDIPAETPFGCLLLDSNNKKVCSMVIEDTNTPHPDGSPFYASTISLASNVSLGAIDCDSKVGTATIDKSQIRPAFSSALSSFDPATLHGNTYKMTCIPTGDADADAECKAENEGRLTFFRYLKGADPVVGMSVWASSTAWADCGSVDISSAIIQSSPVNFAATQGSVGSWTITPAGGACEAREFDPESKPKNIYLINQLENAGGVWSVTDHEKYARSDGIGGTCYLHTVSALSIMPDQTQTYDFLLSFETNNGTDCPTSVAGGFRAVIRKLILGMKKQPGA